MSEDLTTYTEVDPNSRISVTSSRATGAGISRDETCYLYTNKGVGSLDALDIDFDFKCTEFGTSDAFGLIGVSNTINHYYAFGTYDINVLLYKNSSQNWITLNRGASGGSDYYNGFVVNTTYYCTLRRAASADNIYLDIYSDAGRTTLIDTLVVSGLSGQKWQYLFAMGSFNTGAALASSGYVENVLVNGVPKSLIMPSSRRFNSLLVR